MVNQFCAILGECENTGQWNLDLKDLELLEGAEETDRGMKGKLWNLGKRAERGGRRAEEGRTKTLRS